MTPSNPFSSTETKVLGKFKLVMESFGEKSPRIERQEVLCLMWIALNPGINRTDLMRRAELTESTASRNCHRLISHGWVEQRTSHDRSNASAYDLTPAGAAFLRRAAAMLA